MITLKADNRRRVQIPDVKPGQVMEYQNPGDGRFVLTIVKAVAKEPFPADYDFGITEKHNRELLALSKASSLKLP